MSASTPAPAPIPPGSATGATVSPSADVLPILQPAHGEQRRFLIVEMWEDNREIIKAITADVILFLLALTALFIGYVVLHELEKAGYPKDRVARLESLHYWAYVSVAGLFSSDLIVKLFVFLFLRKRGSHNV